MEGEAERAAGLSNLEKCNRIIAEIDMSTFKRLLSQVRGSGPQEMRYWGGYSEASIQHLWPASLSDTYLPFLAVFHMLNICESV